MELAGVIVIAMRWAHLLAAVALVGSAFFWLAFLAPQFATEPRQPLGRAVDAGFRELVDVSLPVFLLSGAILTFDRLSRGQASTGYVAVLGLKIGLALVMFHLAYRTRRGGLAGAQRSLRALVLLGALVLLLAVVLRTI